MSSKVAPDDDKVGSAKIKGKKAAGKAKKEAEAAAGGKFVKKGDEDPFGNPDDYPKGLPLGPRHLVEFHERSDPASSLAAFGSSFGQLLPREQVMLFQQMLVFNQMVGRMIAANSKYAYEKDYNGLIQLLCTQIKDVLKVQKVRIFGVDYNSLGMARELWLVGGERSMLGHRVALEEWAGMSATGPPNPIVSLAPTQESRKYGFNYLELDTLSKFDNRGLCSVGIRMRDPIFAGKARPRYVLEVYNKQRVKGKGVRDFDECDAYVTGCVARTCGAAIAWVLGNMQNARVSEFASATLSCGSLKEFTVAAQSSLCHIFGCEEAVFFFVDEEHDSLWRFPTEEETKRNERIGIALDREFVPFSTSCLAMEAFHKVDMSGSGAQFILNVPNAPKHPRFNSEVDQKYIHQGMLYKKGKADLAVTSTRCVLSCPIARLAGDQHTICVVQLRNKLTDAAVRTDFNREGIFRTDDASFLQHFALQAASIFEHALEEEEGRDAIVSLAQSRYAATALMKISHFIAQADMKVDDLFPLVVDEAIKLMECDRATLWLVKEATGEEDKLVSRIAKGMPPLEVPLKRTSIVGAAVCAKDIENIADAYRDLRFDPTFDRKTGYRTRSIMCVPIIDENRGGRCIGCLQMLNKKDRYGRMGVELFDGRDEQLAQNLASVVAIAIKAVQQSALSTGAIDLAVGVAMRKTQGPGGASTPRGASAASSSTAPAAPA